MNNTFISNNLNLLLYTENTLIPIEMNEMNSNIIAANTDDHFLAISEILTISIFYKYLFIKIKWRSFKNKIKN